MQFSFNNFTLAWVHLNNKISSFFLWIQNMFEYFFFTLKFQHFFFSWYKKQIGSFEHERSKNHTMGFDNWKMSKAVVRALVRFYSHRHKCGSSEHNGKYECVCEMFDTKCRSNVCTIKSTQTIILLRSECTKLIDDIMKVLHWPFNFTHWNNKVWATIFIVFHFSNVKIVRMC